MTGRGELHQVLSGHIERGDLPGLIALVAPEATRHVEVVGHESVRRPRADATRRDLPHRVADQADHRRGGDDPRRRRRRAPRRPGRRPPARARRSPSAAHASTPRSTTPCPPIRPITVEDLLTFRLGFGNVMAPPGTYPIQIAEAELQLATLGPPWPPAPLTPDEWIAAFGTLPLMHQPGEEWMYNTGSQVLGVLRRAGRRQAARGLPARAPVRAAGHADTGVQRVAPAQLRPVHHGLRTRPGNGRARACSTASTTAGGAVRPPCPTQPAGWCPPSTTSGRSRS